MQREVAALAGSENVTLRFLTPEGASTGLDKTIRDFSEITGIKIERIETSTNDINLDLALDHLSQGNRFDIALPATFAVSDLAQSGAIVPLTEYANTHEPDGFRDSILYSSGDTQHGQTYGFQADGDAYLMFYNAGMLGSPEEQDAYAMKFGTPLARARTWAELDRQMAFFHRPEDNQYGGLLFRTAGFVVWEWWVRFHAKGLWPFDAEMEPAIASDAGVAALEEMIAASQYLHPGAKNLDLMGNWKAFAKANTFANLGWGGTQKYMQKSEKVRGKITFGETPGGIINGKLLRIPYFNWGWSYVVTSSCKIPEIAYLFILYASSPEVSKNIVRQTEGFFDPIRAEHYDDPEIQQIYSKEFLDVHRSSLEASIPDLYIPYQSDYFHTLGSWLYRAITGEVPAKEALESVASRWNLITEGAGRASQIENWTGLRHLYPPAIKSQLRDTL